VQNKLLCKKCDKEFSKTSSVTTLRRHLRQIHSVIAPKIQRTLHEYRDDPHNSIDQEKRDEAVINWIICDLQSISVVENEEWRKMISVFDTRYRFHNRTTIHDYIMLKFEEQKVKVKATIQQISRKVSLTSDMWTANNNKAFLSLTIHYIDNDWKLKGFLLDIIPILTQHTAVNITDAIIKVLEEYEICEKVLGLTTDNAAAMVACGT
jgi:hypothetical protein